MSLTSPLLEVDRLTVEFPAGDTTLVAVDDVSFAVEAGEVVGIVGESGSGKSVTALSVLAINLLGDGLRDALDPKLKRMA